MNFVAIESVPRLALKAGEAATALGGEQLLKDLIEHGGLTPVKKTRKETTYTMEAIERALRLAEASGALVEQARR